MYKLIRSDFSGRIFLFSVPRIKVQLLVCEPI